MTAGSRFVFSDVAVERCCCSKVSVTDRETLESEMSLFSRLLSMFARPVVVTCQSDEYVYDGTRHRLLYDVDGLPDGFSIQLEPTLAPLDATGSPIEISPRNATIFNRAGKDVTRRFSIHIRSGTLSILPAPLKVVAESASKVWDGLPLVCDEVQVEGLCEGDDLEVHARGLLTCAGSENNVPIIDWSRSSAKQSNYNVRLFSGTLSVLEANLIVEGRTIEVIYDGVPHSFEVDAPEGATIEFHGISEHTCVGRFSVRFTASLPNHTDTSGVAFLTICPRELVISTGSSSKRFDGVPLVDSSVSVDGLVEGEVLSVQALGSITDVGAEDNTVKIDWESSTARPENYHVSVVPGQLVVLKKTFTAKGKDLEVVYDGLSHSYEIEAPEGASIVFDDSRFHHRVGSYRSRFTASMPGYEDAVGEASLTIREYSGTIVVKTLSAEFVYDGMEHGTMVKVHSLPKGYRVARARSAARVKDVLPEYVTATCNDLRIENYEGEDVTDKLSLVFDDGTLRVTPQRLSIVTFDAHKVFDGEPLVAKGRVNGLCKGEEVTFSTTGVQIEVGESTNTYCIEFDKTAKRTNYQIYRESLGTLRVLPQDDEKGKRSSSSAISSSAPDKRASITSCISRTAMSEPLPIQNVPWYKPEIRTHKLPTDFARLRARVRDYQARPVDERLDLEGAGFGREFKPYDLDEIPLSDRAVSLELRSLETRARQAIDTLLEFEPEGLLFECFPEFDDEDDRLRKAFSQLMNYYAFDMRYALVWIHNRCRNAYLVYIALLARDCYDGDSLWKNLFEMMGIALGDVRTKAKQMFISYLHQRGMVVYERNQTHTYLERTALLHGGLSKTMWEDLWCRSILPLAYEGALSADASGRRVIEALLNESKFSPRNDVVSAILRRAPGKTADHLFSEVWKVALQVARGVVGGEVRLVDSRGLPEAAVLALEAVLDRGRNTRQTADTKVLFLGKISLMLDPAKGVVRFSWNEARLPKSVLGSRVEYLIDGVIVRTLETLPVAGGCVIPAGEMSAVPQSRYDVERRIMSVDSHGFLREIAVLSQSFQNTKPGCFEFVRDARGVYQFRNPDHIITGTKRIAYLVKSNMVVKGVRGMREIGALPGSGDWENMTIFEFEVDPGASGVILDAETGEALSAWNESYRVRVDKAQSIGAAEGVDLYGHVLGTGETDVALPSVRIDTPNAMAASDVEVRFIRDGRPSKLAAKWQFNDLDGSATLYLSLPTSDGGRGIARRCVLEARQSSTHDVLLRYRFAIVPIQGFRLEDYKIDSDTGELIGIYQYEATEPLTIRYRDDNDCVESLETGVPSNLQAPLREDFAFVSMTDATGCAIDAELFLAGVAVTASPSLLAAGRGSSVVSLPVMRRLGYSSGDISITTRQPRRGRHVSLRLGQKRLVDRMLDKTGETRVNIFTDEKDYVPSSGKVWESMPLSISISYGYRMRGGLLEPATAHYEYIECEKGIGVRRCDIRVISGAYRLRLEGGEGVKVPPCPLLVTYLNRTGKVIAKDVAEMGQDNIPLPLEVIRDYEARHPITVRLEMRGLFGQADSSGAIEFNLRRGR